MSLPLLDHTAVWGMIGGIFSEVLKWFSMREVLHTGIPDYAKKPYYWIATAFMVIVGGILAVAYENQENDINPLLAINIGASAPLIAKEFMGNFKNIEKGSTD